MWFRKFPPRLKSGQRLDIAPTWSWAALNGEISYPYFYDGYGPLPPVSVLLDVYSVPAQFNNPYGNLKEGIELLAQILTVSLPTMFTFCLDVEVVSRNGHETMRRSVYWDEVQDDSNEERQHDIVPLYNGYNIDKKIDYAALIVEAVFSEDDVATEEDHIRTFRRIGLLVDKQFEKAFDRLNAEESIYNYGQVQQDMEKLVLV